MSLIKVTKNNRLTGAFALHLRAVFPLSFLQKEGEFLQQPVSSGGDSCHSQVNLREANYQWQTESLSSHPVWPLCCITACFNADETLWQRGRPGGSMRTQFSPMQRERHKQSRVAYIPSRNKRKENIEIKEIAHCVPAYIGVRLRVGFWLSLQSIRIGLCTLAALIFLLQAEQIDTSWAQC